MKQTREGFRYDEATHQHVPVDEAPAPAPEPEPAEE